MSIDISVPISALVGFGLALAIAWFFLRGSLMKIVANSVLGVVAFVLLNIGGFAIAYSLLNIGLVAFLGLPGLVVVIVLKLLGWSL